MVTFPSPFTYLTGYRGGGTADTTAWDAGQSQTKHVSGRHGDAPVNATAAPKRLPQGMPARVPASSGAMEKESDAQNAARGGLLN